jgi:acyl-coenzyme A synthetase/AMP-(fatty) acid ligase
MPDYLSAYAESQPSKPAVIDDRPNGSIRTLSWKQLNEESNRLAHVLNETGHAQPGNKVLDKTR